jgi:DNA-binding CsgD family transcriptional regulator/tetratricopeptide (TPR) repeat protein
MHYLALAEAAEPEMRGPRQKEWLARLEADLDNLRAALAFCLEARDPKLEALDPEHGGARPSPQASGLIELGLRIAGALSRFWWMRGYLSEGLSWLTALLARSAPHPSRARAKALFVAGFLTRSLDNFPAARALFEESLAIGRALGDKRAIIDALYGLADLAISLYDFEQGMALFEESLALARELGDAVDISDSLALLGSLRYWQGDYQQAETILAEILALRRAAGDTVGIAWALQARGWGAQRQGDFGRATRFFAEALDMFRDLGDRTSVASVLGAMGWTARYQGEFARAMALIEESLAIRRSLGDRESCAYNLHDLGYVAYDQGKHAQAAAYFEESLTLFHELGSTPGVAYCLKGFADVAAAQGQADRAARLFGAHASLCEAIGFVFPPIDQAAYDRTVAGVRAQLGAAAFEAAWDAGQALRLEQAVAEAKAGAHSLLADPVALGAPETRNTATARDREARHAARPHGRLTPRERQVLALLARGHTNREIAETLIIAQRTVEIHVSNVLGKLGLATRTQAAAYAIEHGLAESAGG